MCTYLLLLLLATITTCYSQTWEAYEGEYSYLDGTTQRTNDHRYYCGTLDNLGEFKMDSIDPMNIRTGESCRRRCNVDNDCVQPAFRNTGSGMFCYNPSPLGSVGVLQAFMNKPFCMCRKDLPSPQNGCAIGQRCLSRYDEKGKWLDQQCVCDPQAAVSNVCGAAGVCQEQKVGYKWVLTNPDGSTQYYNAGVCKKKCNYYYRGESDPVGNGKICLRLSNIKTSTTRDPNYLDDSYEYVFSCDPYKNTGCPPNQECFVRSWTGTGTQSTPVYDTVCRPWKDNPDACRQTVNGAILKDRVTPDDIDLGVDQYWKPSWNNYKWFKVNGFNGFSYSFIEATPGECRYDLDSRVKGSNAQIDTCRLDYCSNAGSCLCPIASASNVFYHTIQGVVVVNPNNLEPVALGGRCAVPFNEARLGPNKFCKCDSEQVEFRSLSSRSSFNDDPITTLSPGCAFPSFDYDQCNGNGVFVPNSNTCRCKIGWTGPSCSQNCKNTLCNGHGTCYKEVSGDPYSKNLCTCNVGYEDKKVNGMVVNGGLCSMPTKENIEQVSCAGNGIWFNSNCICSNTSTSYTGSTCETCIYPISSPDVGRFKPNCIPNCCTANCATTLCNNHGTCYKSGDVIGTINSCQCNSNWTGVYCEQPIDLAGRVCGGIDNGRFEASTKTCICNPGSSFDGHVCVKGCASFIKSPPTCDLNLYSRGECANQKVCGGPWRGSCEVINPTVSLDKACVCKNGFTGLDCSIARCPVSNGVPCGGSHCITSLGVCVCKAGFVGFACDIPELSCGNGQVRKASNELILPREFTFKNTDYKYL